MPHPLISRRGRWSAAVTVAVVLGLTGLALRPALAASGGAAVRPIMGWSSWSFYRGPGTQADILAQAQAMKAKLPSHGYTYINLDAGWSDHVDRNGRDVWDSSLFPDATQALARKP